MVAPTQIINVEKQDLLAQLDRIGECCCRHRESRLRRSMPPSPNSPEHHHVRKVAIAEDCAATSFSMSQACGHWPAYGSFLNASTRGKIATIYAADLARYADHF